MDDLKLLLTILIPLVIIMDPLGNLPFFFSPWIRRVLGLGGIRVATRLMGLLLAVIAVQFMVSGFQQIK